MELSDKRVLVFGSGKSGLAAYSLLKKAGARPYLFDQNEHPDMERITQVLGDDAEVVAGILPEIYFRQTELVVISPGIPCDLPIVEELKAADIPIWGEIELAYRLGKGKVLAVTGTNGKTTTTALLGKIMGDYYPRVDVVGNIGNPYTDAVWDQMEDSYTVAEISSFQLETISTFHPIASAITNITEDHLNRHHTMEEYIRVKELIAKNQGAEDLCVLNYEDPVLREFGEGLSCQVMYFSSERALQDGIFYMDDAIYFSKLGVRECLLKTDELQLLGKHNFENVMVAAAMAAFAGVPIDRIRESAKAFAGVEHRIEYVTEKNGVRFYNDSKGTNPDAAIKAIQAMNRPTLLIGGGYDKQSTYEEWIRAFDGKVKYLLLIGVTAEKIKETALREGFPESRMIMAETLENAIRFCHEHAASGDAVLLSPACASWDQFDSYEQRGDIFKELVRALPEN